MISASADNDDDLFLLAAMKAFSPAQVIGPKLWGVGARVILLLGAVKGLVRGTWLPVILGLVGLPVLVTLYIRASRQNTLEAWALLDTAAFGFWLADSILYLFTH
jgi:hypothetical protein